MIPGFCRAAIATLTSLWLFAPTAQAGFACNDPVIDALEISRTPIAAKLMREGFLEDPQASGIYKRKGVSWNWLKKTFRVADQQPALAASVATWTATTRIEGNHTVLELTKEARGGFNHEALLAVTVNLGYARPRQVCVGMTTRRVHEALALIEAEEKSGSICRRAARAQKGVAHRCYLLPDGKGLVVREERKRRKSWQKPVEPLVTSLLVGKQGTGLQNFRRRNPEALTRLSIFAYRTDPAR